MRIQAKRDYGILTGDVVASSKLTPSARRDLQRAFERIDRDLRRRFPQDCPLPLEVFRGDSWQLLAVRPESSLRLSLFVRAALRVHLDRSIDTRISIGVGRIEFIPKESVTRGDGPAYRLSGGGLDEMPRQVRLSLRRGDVAGRTSASADAPGAGSSPEPSDPQSSPRAERCDDIIDALLITVDALSRPWTASQSQAVLGALFGKTQESIAADWKPEPISQQAVAQHLNRARWFAVERSLRAFENRTWSG